MSCLVVGPATLAVQDLVAIRAACHARKVGDDPFQDEWPLGWRHCFLAFSVANL